MNYKKALMGIVLLTLCVLGIFAEGSQVYAEETVSVIREKQGDLEQLEAIEISDDIAKEWKLAESWKATTSRVSSAANQFLDYGSDYGYQDMQKRSNGDNRQYAYQQMEELCKMFSVNGADAEVVSASGSNFMAAGSIDLEQYPLTEDEKAEVYFTFRNDNPQYFWLSNQMLWSKSSIVILTYDEYGSGTSRINALEEIVKTANDVYQSKITPSQSRYQIVLTIHDALISDIEYSHDTSVPIAHSIAGAMTSGRTAVCEGYAKVMQVMMNCYGISNIYVTGDAGGPHAWNMVYMNDGKYYWLDATWDDQPYEEFQHDYFLVGNRDFSDHKADLPTDIGTEFLYELPMAADDIYIDDPDVAVIVKGDINEDGSVNLLDLMLCLNHVSKKELLMGDSLLAGDIDENGEVNLLDLMRILNYVSKKSAAL